MIALLFWGEPFFKRELRMVPYDERLQKGHFSFFLLMKNSVLTAVL